MAGMHRKTLLNMMHAGHIRGIGRADKRKTEYLVSADDLKKLTDQRFSEMRSVAIIIRLLMLHGSRYGEMAQLAWGGFDDKNGILHIPTVNADGTRRIKSNGAANKDLTLYTSQVAIDLINKMPHRPGRDFLFGIGPHGLTENDIQKKKLDAIILKSEGAPIVYIRPHGTRTDEHWTLHWLRHSFSTRLDEDLDADPRLVRSITNHLNEKQKIRLWGGENEPGMHFRYTHSKYAAKQRRLLEQWANVLQDAAKGIYHRNDEGVVWGTQFNRTA